MDILLMPRNAPKFGSLKPGDVFLGEDSMAAYMKIAPVTEKGNPRNVLRLRDGALCTFNDTCTVIVPKQAQLSIEE